MASRILGMGDILSLVEEAREGVDEAEAKKLAEKFKKGKGFDLEDFKGQIAADEEDGRRAVARSTSCRRSSRRPRRSRPRRWTTRSLRRIEGIINSMTPAERAKPELIKASRKRRIAAGAGVPVQEVNRLLNQFEQMQKMMKMMQKGGMAKMMRSVKGMTGQRRGADERGRLHRPGAAIGDAVRRCGSPAPPTTAGWIDRRAPFGASAHLHAAALRLPEISKPRIITRFSEFNLAGMHTWSSFDSPVAVRNKRPFYNMVVADSRFAADGRFIERIGFYDPKAPEGREALRVNVDRLTFWEGKGAKMSPTVARLVRTFRKTAGAAKPQ